MQSRIFHNTNMLTLDPSRPRAQAVLVEGGKISLVGSDREVLGKAPPRAQRIDLQGKTLLPGFNDNHIHVQGLGESAWTLKIHSLNEQEIVERLKQRFAGCTRGAIITAEGWDYHSCPHPHRFLLDEAFPDNPVLLWQMGGHALWVNTRALREMKIDLQGPGSASGTIPHSAEGQHTGIVIDYVNNRYIQNQYRKRLKNKRILREQILLGLRELSKVGITTAQDNTWHHPIVQLLSALHREGRLTCRLSCWFLGESPVASLLMRMQSFDTDWFHRGLCKYFEDGSFSGRSAWLTSPYADDGKNCGSGRSAEELTRKMAPQVKRRRQIACHAIGDRAVEEYLNAVEELQRRYPWTRELRLRVEHAQLVRPWDMDRLRDLGVLVAAQPSALSSPQKDVALLGEERALRAYPYRSLLEHGVQLSFGSDAPSETDLDPLLCIHRAVNRPGPEAISAFQAFECYTRGSAYAELREDEKGAIIPGMYADFVVLSEDPLSVPSQSIKDIQVMMTVVDGRIVYEAAGGTT
jgi:predicted amidohydrolase YtcJ